MIDGTTRVTQRRSWQRTSAQAPIHEYDVAEAAAETLLSDDHLGEAIPLTGPRAHVPSRQ
ncbi:hypothetical protein HCN51_27345 [Nonomuraea sp. FMUSA5-5]|uniref:Uncharacterized protein n=1 Tax=Nonomuraea composti TaxID=2720023 RepID=A0ABX1BE53_9ACTN|nr:hypothetical protein [Nonomuraea sp. FMUSA5-5]NJP93118.1 hypothetical protein [Nonomuraea sp. FMUSA5-5]